MTNKRFWLAGVGVIASAAIQFIILTFMQNNTAAQQTGVLVVQDFLIVLLFDQIKKRHYYE